MLQFDVTTDLGKSSAKSKLNAPSDLNKLSPYLKISKSFAFHWYIFSSVNNTVYKEIASKLCFSCICKSWIALVKRFTYDFHNRISGLKITLHNSTAWQI